MEKLKKFWARNNLTIKFVLRLLLAGILIGAGASKITNLAASVLAVRGYQISFLSYDVVKIIGYSLPIIEIFFGVMLLVGLFTRYASFIGAVLMTIFILAIASVWYRGISIDCGCFGGGGTVQQMPNYFLHILGDLALLLGYVYLAVKPKTLYSADDALGINVEAYEM